MSKYYIDGNNWVKKNVPSTKQIEEITTNNTIKCTICNKNVTEYVSVIDAFRYDNDIDIPLGYCCYPCADRNTLNHMTAYMTQDGKRYVPELLISATPVPLDAWGYVSDTTKNRIDDINKHRDRVKAYIKYCKGGGLIPKSKRKAGVNTIKDKMIEWRKDSTFDMMMKIADGEITVD